MNVFNSLGHNLTVYLHIPYNKKKLVVFVFHTETLIRARGMTGEELKTKHYENVEFECFHFLRSELSRMLQCVRWKLVRH